MSDLKILDTFPQFCRIWEELAYKSFETKVDIWENRYMSQYPELLKMQLDNYADENADWKEITKEHVFPFLEKRMPAMKHAHKNILKVADKMYLKSKHVLDFEVNAVFIVYVGIGCGAGWVTSYQNQPAILLGLENIAECRWESLFSIEGLLSHEIGHLFHDQMLRQNKRNVGSGPFWQLYREGFAQRCEHVIAGKETWHESRGINDNDWLQWCKENKTWLADEFIKSLKSKNKIRRFFGHWYNIEGRRQCGYYLGHELIKQFEMNGKSLREIAILENAEKQIETILKGFAEHGV